MKARTPKVAPSVGDIVCYVDRKNGTTGHTGRCLSLSTRTVSLQEELLLRRKGRRLHVRWEDVEGFWRRNAKNRSPERLVKLEW